MLMLFRNVLPEFADIGFRQSGSFGNDRNIYIHSKHIGSDVMVTFRFAFLNALSMQCLALEKNVAKSHAQTFSNKIENIQQLWYHNGISYEYMPYTGCSVPP